MEEGDPLRPPAALAAEGARRASPSIEARIILAALFTDQFCLAQNAGRKSPWNLELSKVRFDNVPLTKAISQLKEQIPFYDVRHSIKPGVTGWAQVRYSYGASVDDARKKHQFDLYYVKNNSLLLDLLVLIETVSVVLFREGAH